MKEFAKKRTIVMYSYKGERICQEKNAAQKI